MSGDDHDRTPHDERDEPTDDDHWLSSLLSALDWLDSASTSGQRRSDRTVLDYDISIRTGDSLDDRSGTGDRPFGDADGFGPDRERDRRRGRPRTRRHRPSRSPSSSAPSSDHHLTTRESDDELLVTADVAGADPDDVTVGFDGATLVVAVAGRELDRIEVPWRERTADATIKNGVLTVTVVPATDGASPTEGDR